MTIGVRKPCLDCGKLTDGASRCEPCRLAFGKVLDAKRDPAKRKHYSGNYRARAKAVRESATVCWLCGEGARDLDPWQADHVLPGQSDSPLLPAHRSCNIRKGNSIAPR